MSFIWPPFLLLLLAIPVGRVGVSVARAAAGGAGGAVRVGRRGGRRRAPWRRGARRRGPLDPPPPGRADRRRRHDPRPLAGPAAERHRRPAARGHGHPRVRRLGQHGGHRRRARPGWRRPRPRPSTSSSGSRRRCASASSCSATPGSRPRSRPTTASSVVAAIQPAGAASAAPRSAAASSQALDGHRGRRRPGDDRLLHEPLRRARRPDPTPVPAGVYEPAIIVLLTDGENTVEPGSARGGPGRQGPRHPHRHGRDRQPGRHDARGRGLPASTPSSTRRRSRTSPT